MTSPNLVDINSIIMVMMIISIINLLTIKTSIMCLNLILFIFLLAIMISSKMSMSPLPFIIFLTMIGGLMVIFLYFASTLWMKKEVLTLKTKISMITLTVPMILAIPFKFSYIKSDNSLLLFNNNFNKLTIIMILILTVVLIYVIEIHMKANRPFRRKLKIWE